MSPLTVHDPRGYPPKVRGKRLAARPQNLTGKTLYLVDCLFDNSDAFVEQLRTWFAEHLPAATVRVDRPKESWVDDPDLRARVEERVDRRPQAVLQVHQQEGRVLGAVAGVEHQPLGEHRPPFREGAGGEDLLVERCHGRAVGVPVLHVVPGERLVDRQAVQGVVVVLAQERRLDARVLGGGFIARSERGAKAEAMLKRLVAAE